MAEPMIYTLLAAHIPLEQRGRAIGWLVTGATLAPMIGAPVMGYIAGLGGWRMAFLGFVLPIALLGLGSAAKGVPSSSQGPHPSKGQKKFLEGLKEVLSTRSAVACLGGSSLP